MLCIENTLVSSNYQNCNHMLYITISYIHFFSIPGFHDMDGVSLSILHASSIHLWAKCPPSTSRSPNPPVLCTGQSHASWWRAQLACWAVRSCSCFRAPTGRLGDAWSTCTMSETAISVWLAGVWPLQKQGTSSTNSVLWFDTRRCLLAYHAGVPAPGLGAVGRDSNRKVACFEANTSRVKRVHLAGKLGLGSLCLAFQLCKVLGGGASHCSRMAARRAAAVSGTSTEAECWCRRLFRYGRVANESWMALNLNISLLNALLYNFWSCCCKWSVEKGGTSKTWGFLIPS